MTPNWCASTVRGAALVKIEWAVLVRIVAKCSGALSEAVFWTPRFSTITIRARPNLRLLVPPRSVPTLLK